MAELKDSGERREFVTGAVRDIAEGKGRMDLLPLDIVALYFNEEITDELVEHQNILTCLSSYIRYGRRVDLLYAAYIFIHKEMQTDDYTAFIELSKHYEDGAKKYDERNWEKGILLHCYIDSALRHYMKFKRGDTDEPHDRAFLWNVFGAAWTQTHVLQIYGVAGDSTIIWIIFAFSCYFFNSTSGLTLTFKFWR